MLIDEISPIGFAAVGALLWWIGFKMGQTEGFSKGLAANEIRVRKLIQNAAQDPNVRAIILDVGSPGGSVGADECMPMDVLWEQIGGKPE